MNKYDKAAELLGRVGAIGETESMVDHLHVLSKIEQSGSELTEEDKKVIEHALDRVSDEINIVLGEVLDAIVMVQLKLSDDDVEDIIRKFKSLRNKPNDNTDDQT